MRLGVVALSCIHGIVDTRDRERDGSWAPYRRPLGIVQMTAAPAKRPLSHAFGACGVTWWAQRNILFSPRPAGPKSDGCGSRWKYFRVQLDSDGSDGRRQAAGNVSAPASHYKGPNW